MNISADGYISHDLFDIGWSTITSMVEIFRALNKLLVEPNLRDAVSEENAQLYQQNHRDYELRVYKHCQQYASKTIEQLQYTFRLEYRQ